MVMPSMTTTKTLRSTVQDQKNYKNKVDEQHTFSDNIFVCSYALITVMPSLFLSVELNVCIACMDSSSKSILLQTTVRDYKSFQTCLVVLKQ